MLINCKPIVSLPLFRTLYKLFTNYGIRGRLLSSKYISYMETHMNSLNQDCIAKVIKCVNFAANKHQSQRRKDPEKTPYINHPIGVAFILTEEANVSDLDVILAAILHDTVEDTDTSFTEIENMFGPNVRNIVEEVTDDKNAPKEERKEMQILHAPTSSLQAKLVKLADKLYNLRDLNRATPSGWSDDRVQEYFVWAKRVVHGLKGSNKQMEDSLNALFTKRGVL